MKSVVKSVVTRKSGLSIRYYCETFINWGKRVDFLPLYITNSRNCEYSQILTPIFLVTTKVTTVLANFSLGGNCHGRYQLYPDESCTSARGANGAQSSYLAREIPSPKGTISNLNKEVTIMKKGIIHDTKSEAKRMKNGRLFLAYCCIDGIECYGKIFDRVPLHWYAENRKKPIVDYQDLVIGYEGLNEYEKERARDWIDEGFTEEEISIIRPIIERSGYDFEVREMAMPVIIQEDERFPFWSYADLFTGSGEHFANLKGHGLPFDVVCYYNLNNAIERDARNVDKIPKEAA
jgi:hypothetical protein